MEQDLDILVAGLGESPDPAQLKDVVGRLEPTINGVLHGMGAAGDPALRAQARVLAAGAVRSYKPDSGASVKTWVSRSLQPLRREKRMKQGPVTVPDRTVLDAYRLHKAEREYEDKHGREPSLEELSDFASTPIKRIRKVRSSFRPSQAEGALEVQVSGGLSDFTEEALEAVYNDSQLLDKRIIELRTGYAGHTPGAPGDVAARLKLSPSALSKRSAAIAARVAEIERALES